MGSYLVMTLIMNVKVKYGILGQIEPIATNRKMNVLIEQ